MHTQKNHAYNAINCKVYDNHYPLEAMVYEHINGEWVEIDRFDAPTDCAHCGRNIREVSQEVIAERRAANPGAGYVNVYDVKGHQLDAGVKPSFKNPFVCHNCWHDHFTRYSRRKEWIDHENVGQLDPGETIRG
jgi:hypothetical protein